MSYNTPHRHAPWCPKYNPDSKLIVHPRVATTVSPLHPTPGRPRFDLDEHEMWTLYGDGYNYAEIADILGVSRTTIRRRITEHR